MMQYKTKLILLCLSVVVMLVLRDWLTSSMALHMAVQIPMLVILGAFLAQILQQRYSRLKHFGQRYRYSLLLFTLFTFGLWMLPLLLDASLHHTEIAIIKWLVLPLAGMSLVLSWQHLPFVLRGILHLEALATLLRLGWLYLIAPQRYCVSYVLDDQTNLGYVLLGYGIMYGVFLAGKIMFGRHNLPLTTDN